MATKELDIAFVVDCTLSMGPYIENVRNSIREIVEQIKQGQNIDTRLALVEYRDHSPQDETFVTRTHDFTSSIDEMKQWLDECEASGGGDLPEAVADALADANNLSWRSSATKICLVITDAPPHGIGIEGDTLPLGWNNYDPIVVVNQMAQRGIVLYTVGCEPSIFAFKDFYEAIAFTTGGQYIPLINANLLAKVIIGSSQSEISLERLMPLVEQEVEAQIGAANGVINEALINAAVFERLKAEGATTKYLFVNNTKLESNEQAMYYSKFFSLDDYMREFRVSGPERYQIERAFIEAPMALGADIYRVASDLINSEQTGRLVQKALQRRKQRDEQIVEEVGEKEEVLATAEQILKEDITQLNKTFKNFIQNNKDAVASPNVPKERTKSTTSKKSKKYTKFVEYIVVHQQPQYYQSCQPQPMYSCYPPAYTYCYYY